ncbi:MAG: hypothetical protein DME84_03850 [Verrucomicrobia bacterium]|nr:MAG: hypothetical protein DME84_03850 [Verrucomicrobiota bacterium]PYK49512.1 MAG: hypothetical protein DME51_08130 [Verrucomicrobiota bacterium]
MRWQWSARCAGWTPLRGAPTNQQFRFTSAPELRQPCGVRKSVAISLLVLAALSCVRGQDQERKLVDRLLKPDMTLQNDAQHKKFVADGTSMNKRASVGTFYVQKKSNQKNFSGTGQFSTQQFNSQSFHSKSSAFNVPSQQATGNSRPAYANQSARGVRDASQSGKKVSVGAYAENRPFLDEGKSQKSLNRQNAPLTIEQVRELLNKNK